ncbi:hypothetical protein GKG47_15825 [Lactonifactor sp. BIOML-A3]|uniref:replication initiator protein A n=1 Tax=unclassified Lactonifactor TaxID=2636670 RepID=UPI0012B04643|nr:MULTISPECIES: replication initiator protein A [unclassified Lactonifactor]MSA01708.1 hypothetical protein [Lactonifactor sp. BIOML-A5]MSA08706.1 hypothetical protein [Lactonifactor sp. BIOML-A4]MSA13898.1 hypothetical protein [Lactonifactor sp. BIOML-A3]MSA17139.1 hypothetical protein [Lactonifactor sp. BIOML-A2]MSA37818.1 hypothetical protein [Lactonifactor sp. BIOML-A1]
MNTTAIEFDYFYGMESQQFAFYRIPKMLVKDERFKKVSNDAKLLYGLLLDRMSLSQKNGWFDDKNRAYIIYTIDEIAEDLGIGHEKAGKILGALDSKKGIGLVERVRRGQGKPDIIYVKNFVLPQKKASIGQGKSMDMAQKSENQTSRDECFSEIRKPDFLTSENQISGNPNIRSLDIRNSDANYNIHNYTDMNYPDPIYQSTEDALNAMGVLPPAEYKRSNGLNYDSGFRIGSGVGWSPTSVNRILANEIYIGTMVQGTNRKISYKIKQTRAVPKEDWIRVENTHEPIVSKEIFEEVQRLLLFDTRTSPDEDAVYLFSGLVVCGDCWQNMVRRRVSKGRKKYSYFHCSTYKSGKGCSSHLFSAKQLEEIVTETVQKQISLFLKAQSIIETIDQIPQEQSRVKVIVQQMEELQKEIDRYRGFKTKAYEDMLEGIIDKDEFVFMKRTFTDKINAAEARYKHLQIEKATAISDKQRLKPWVENLKQYQNIEKLERPIVVALIEQIIVYDKENIVIKMHFEDEMQDVIRMAEAASEEFASEEMKGCV